MIKTTTTAITLASLLPLSLIGQATSSNSSPADTEPVVQLDTFQVIGSQQAVFDTPGSGVYLDSEVLERFSSKNVNDILRQAPGVYVRDEDGYGLFPNISIRGVDTNRSGKVTTMEDGVLTAPAPYSSPSAYYSPTAGRMSGIEILKGSSQIHYGPHTTGGVINYISTPIPETTEGFLSLSYGTDSTINGHITYGGTMENDLGTFGGVVELYHEEADGFREIQKSTNGAYNGSDDTGYERTDYMVKLSFEPNWERRNHFELKFGYSNLDADESYLGLTDADIKNNPYDRYAASALDNIETEHFRSHLRHLVEFDTDSRLSTTLYYSAFARDWNKLDKVDGTNPAELIETNPGVLQGATLGSFKIKSNDREYYLFGIQSKYEHSFETGELQHNLTLGARLHKDKIDRYQDAKTYGNVTDGLVFAGDFDDSAASTVSTYADKEGNREQETVALALSAEDRIEVGNWTFSPGLRVEFIDWDYIRRDGGSRPTNPETDSGSYSVFAGGLGIEYELNEQSKLFGGYYRGFSVPSPSGKKDGKEYDEEISDTFEIGYRYQDVNSVYLEAAIFYTALSDLIVEDSIAGGAGDGNVGDTETFGLELLVGADFGTLLDQSYGIPVRLAFTYTDATLDGDAASESAESIFAAGKDGNQVPYIPEFQISFTTGLEFEKLSLYAILTYVDERYADARNSSDSVNADGDPDARFGKLDSFITVDLSAKYQLTEDLELFANANNIFEEEYVTSRIPHGPRSGAPRLISAGFNYRF